MADKLNMIASLYQAIRPKKKAQPDDEEAEKLPSDQTIESVRKNLGGAVDPNDPLKKKKPLQE